MPPPPKSVHPTPKHFLWGIQVDSSSHLQKMVPPPTHTKFRRENLQRFIMRNLPTFSKRAENRNSHVGWLVTTWFWKKFKICVCNNNFPIEKKFLLVGLCWIIEQKTWYSTHRWCPILDTFLILKSDLQNIPPKNSSSVSNWSSSSYLSY